MFSQENKDVIGEWYNAEKDAVITIFEDNNSLSGKITWMLYPNDEDGNPKTDPLNPDKKLRDRLRLGMVMMHSFKHIDANVWDNGKLYDPKQGKTYSGMLTLKDENTLSLRGYKRRFNALFPHASVLLPKNLSGTIHAIHHNDALPDDGTPCWTYQW